MSAPVTLSSRVQFLAPCAATSQSRSPRGYTVLVPVPSMAHGLPSPSFFPRSLPSHAIPVPHEWATGTALGSCCSLCCAWARACSLPLRGARLPPAAHSSADEDSADTCHFGLPPFPLAACTAYLISVCQPSSSVPPPFGLLHAQSARAFASLPVRSLEAPSPLSSISCPPPRSGASLPGFPRLGRSAEPT